MSRFYKALQQAERDHTLWATHGPAGVGEKASARDEPRAPVAAEGPPGARLEGHDRPRRTVTGSGRPPDVPVETVTPVESVDVFRPGVDQHLVSLLAPASFEAECYRTLRHAVEQLHHTVGVSVIAVSSPCVGDGKTVTAINLAGALAQAPEARVLLVDTDLRQSRLADYLSLDHLSGPGLVGAILSAPLRLESVVVPCPPFNLALVPTGSPPAAPYEVLKSPRLGALLEEARHQYDYVVLDTPPLIPIPDCRVIGKWVDGFLVVVAAHGTPRRLLDEALGVMDPAKILGLVFNMDDQVAPVYYVPYGEPTNGDGAFWWSRLARHRGRR